MVIVIEMNLSARSRALQLILTKALVVHRKWNRENVFRPSTVRSIHHCMTQSSHCGQWEEEASCAQRACEMLMSHLILKVANAVDLWERRCIKINLKTLLMKNLFWLWVLSTREKCLGIGRLALHKMFSLKFYFTSRLTYLRQKKMLLTNVMFKLSLHCTSFLFNAYQS